MLECEGSNNELLTLNHMTALIDEPGYLNSDCVKFVTIKNTEFLLSRQYELLAAIPDCLCCILFNDEHIVACAV